MFFASASSPASVARKGGEAQGYRRAVNSYQYHFEVNLNYDAMAILAISAILEAPTV